MEKLVNINTIKHGNREPVVFLKPEICQEPQDLQLLNLLILRMVSQNRITFTSKKIDLLQWDGQNSGPETECCQKKNGGGKTGKENNLKF